MAVEIIVDGYNLINKWSILKDKFKINPDDARIFLVDILAHYKKIKRHKIKIVFDAYNSYSLIPSKFSEKGIKIIFTSMNETADDFIKKNISRNGEQYIVVSSDNEIKNFAGSHDSVYINSEDFIQKLEFAFYMDTTESYQEESYIPRLSTKKKGNPKKLPKKSRKFQHKINKL